MTVQVPETLTRDELQVYLRMSRQFVDTWLKAPEGGSIPPMPRYNVNPVQFDRDAVREWYRKHFQIGGDE